MLVEKVLVEREDDFYNEEYVPVEGMYKTNVSVPVPKFLKYKEAVPEHNIRARYHRGIKFGDEWLNIFYYNITADDFGKNIIATIKVEEKRTVKVENGFKIFSIYLVVSVYKICTKSPAEYSISFPTEGKLERIPCEQDLINHHQIPGTNNFVLLSSKYVKRVEAA